ncbi:hypothetical protein ACR782_10655 [Sphingobacterium spiritivorum]|uniref:hypothetical protein n=1 Tax=Sphingobacterium spiritivorum TaxID=258 RepID=UPI003DA3D844
METKFLISQLTAFYPVGIPITNEKSYNESVENQRKVKAINGALKNRDQWEKTKQSILSDFELYRISDFSFAAGYPTYYASFKVEQESSLMYSIFISVILPYYCVRVIDIEKDIKWFKPLTESEAVVFKQLSSIITSNFIDFKIIDDRELLEFEVSNIEFDYANPPTIADLLFSTLEA